MVTPVSERVSTEFNSGARVEMVVVAVDTQSSDGQSLVENDSSDEGLDR
jgi:hypothetical protein